MNPHRIFVDNGRRQFLQTVPLGLGKIDLLAFPKNGYEKNGQVIARVKRYRTDASALAFVVATNGKPYLPAAASPDDLFAVIRVRCNVVYKSSMSSWDIPATAAALRKVLSSDTVCMPRMSM